MPEPPASDEPPAGDPKPRGLSRLDLGVAALYAGALLAPAWLLANLLSSYVDWPELAVRLLPHVHTLDDALFGALGPIYLSLLLATLALRTRTRALASIREVHAGCLTAAFAAAAAGAGFVFLIWKIRQWLD